MADICTDNRFELIKKYKDKLIEATNIEADEDEMKVIDNILFRCWQMGWLDRLESIDAPVVRCKDCKHFYGDGGNCTIDSDWIFGLTENDYCSRAERMDGEEKDDALDS